MKETRLILKEAKEASLKVNFLSSEEKNKALDEMAKALLLAKEEIISENEKDLAAAEGSISPVMMDRLRLTAERIDGMAAGIRALISLPDVYFMRISLSLSFRICENCGLGSLFNSGASVIFTPAIFKSPFEPFKSSLQASVLEM